MAEHVIVGIQRGSVRIVRFDGKIMNPKRSQRVWNHSPDGFAWGYGGSGPAQLALAILLKVLPEREAVLLHQFFKREFIERLPQDDFRLPVDVQAWADNKLNEMANRAI